MTEPQAATDEVGAGDGITRRTSRLAVASFILGLAFFLPAAPAAAVVLGMWALVSISSSEGRLKGRWFAWVGVATGAAFAVLIYLVLPIYVAKTADTLQAKNNLGKIGKGLAVYRTLNGGTMPADLQTLINSAYISDAGVLERPGSGLPPVENDALDETAAYLYFPLKTPADPKDESYWETHPVAWERMTWSGRGKVLVLFADAHVVLMKADYLRELVDAHRGDYLESPAMPSKP